MLMTQISMHNSSRWLIDSTVGRIVLIMNKKTGRSVACNPAAEEPRSGSGQQRSANVQR